MTSKEKLCLLKKKKANGLARVGHKAQGKMKQVCRSRRSIIILNEKGLHTRPAAELVRCLQAFDSEVFLSYQGLTVNAKSLLGILMLTATRGAKVQVEAEGSDAEEATAFVVRLALKSFDIVY